jgi:hypothetical protein
MIGVQTILSQLGTLPHGRGSWLSRLVVSRLVMSRLIGPQESRKH